MSQDLNITETVANTAALNANTNWIIISIFIAIILFILGLVINKFRSKNIVKNTKNKDGKIIQIDKDNLVDNVDNENGIIEQN